MSRIKFLFFAILFGVPVFFHFFIFCYFSHCARFAFNLCLCFTHNFCAIFCWFIFWHTFVYFFRFAHNFNYLPVEKGKSCSVELLVWPEGVCLLLPPTLLFPIFPTFSSFHISTFRSQWWQKLFALLLFRMQSHWIHTQTKVHTGIMRLYPLKIAVI